MSGTFCFEGCLGELFTAVLNERSSFTNACVTLLALQTLVTMNATILS